jgi:ABC-type sugar transport system substrate-binding protein
MEGVRSNPDAEGIFLTNEDASLAYLELLHDGKLPARKIYAVGYDIGPAIIQGISDGHLLGTIFQDPARLGSIAVQELLTLLKQPQLDVPVKSKEILVPVKKITRDNLPTPL